MSESVEHKAVILSQKLYRRLLAAYPKAHREEYGPAMAQLFRDQCREAWRDARGRGMVILWLRVLPDLVKTSVLEHLANLQGRKSMLERIAVILGPRSARRSVFLAVAVGVFLLVFGTSMLVTFILPESYSSTVRVAVQPAASTSLGINGPQLTPGAYDPYFIQTEFEIIRSKLLLYQVIINLNLNQKWADKFKQKAELRTDLTYSLLKRQIDVRQSRNTSLIEIRAFSEDKNEAAIIANEIAKVYRDSRFTQQQVMANRSIRDLEKRCQWQEQRVQSAQNKVDRLRNELSVPEPEPAVNELRAKYSPYWEAKRALDVASRFLDDLRLQMESKTLDAATPGTSLVEIVDRAEPGYRPVRPNKPLYLFLGAVAGMLLALAVGAVAAWAVFVIGRKLQRTAATS